MIALLLPAALAATITVDPAGGGDYATVGAAMLAASSGDTLSLAAGTYAECLDPAGKSLTLTGAGADSTVLDGAGCSYALVVYSGETLTLQDLALTAEGGRGAYVSYSALALTRVRAYGMGHESAYGGAIEAYVSTLTFDDCVFEDNTGLYGGALYAAYYNTVLDQGSTWQRNTAVYDGGAIYTYGYDTVTLQGSTLTENQAGGGGGALEMVWDYGLTLTDSTVSHNTAAGNGGGVYLYAVDPTSTVENSRFEGNQAGGYGGALELEWYTAVEIAGSRFVQNEAAGWGGAIFTYVLDALDVHHSDFCANTAPYGGAVGVQWTTVDSHAHNVYQENTAVQGGALYRYASGAGVLQNNTLVGNTSSDWGGAYFAGWYAYGSFVNNLVVGSSAGTGIYASDPYDYGYTTVAYNGFSDNAPIDAGGYFYVESGVDGNLTADPAFVAYTRDGDCTDDDLRLGSGSPMRDAGDPALADPDGSRSDIGAWGGPDAPVEDLDGDGVDTTEDCDDTNPDIQPDAAEICDGLDNDCDGERDGAAAAGVATWYTDWDGDGYGDPTTGVIACDAPEGTIADGTDCDDINPYQSPGTAEVCDDGVDQDCTGADLACADGAPADTGGSGADKPDEAGTCGCATAPSTGWLLLFGAALGLGRRRDRRPIRADAPGGRSR